jgi:hypothetical protein
MPIGLRCWIAWGLTGAALMPCHDGKKIRSGSPGGKNGDTTALLKLGSYVWLPNRDQTSYSTCQIGLILFVSVMTVTKKHSCAKECQVSARLQSLKQPPSATLLLKWQRNLRTHVHQSSNQQMTRGLHSDSSGTSMPIMSTAAKHPGEKMPGCTQKLHCMMASPYLFGVRIKRF